MLNVRRYTRSTVWIYPDVYVLFLITLSIDTSLNNCLTKYHYATSYYSNNITASTPSIHHNNFNAISANKVDVEKLVHGIRSSSTSQHDKSNLFVLVRG